MNKTVEEDRDTAQNTLTRRMTTYGRVFLLKGYS